MKRRSVLKGLLAAVGAFAFGLKSQPVEASTQLRALKDDLPPLRIAFPVTFQTPLKDTTVEWVKDSPSSYVPSSKMIDQMHDLIRGIQSTTVQVLKDGAQIRIVPDMNGVVKVVFSGEGDLPDSDLQIRAEDFFARKGFMVSRALDLYVLTNVRHLFLKPDDLNGLSPEQQLIKVRDTYQVVKNARADIRKRVNWVRLEVPMMRAS